MGIRERVKSAKHQGVQANIEFAKAVENVEKNGATYNESITKWLFKKMNMKWAAK